MFYSKNLPVWERLVRSLAALAMAYCAYRNWGTPAAYVWAVGGAVTGLTSVVGFCPMCAFAGRRIAANTKAAG